MGGEADDQLCRYPPPTLLTVENLLRRLQGKVLLATLTGFLAIEESYPFSDFLTRQPLEGGGAGLIATGL